MGRGPVIAGPVEPRSLGSPTRYEPWSVPVLDLVFLATVVALFALVSALATGVEKL